ncbi:MAG: LytR/AlgR family response regulator transcription factor [Eubacterium sp.]
MKIAIVDDEQKWRNLASEVVENYIDKSEEIEIFDSGVEFLKRNAEYNIVLMDIDMPKMDGFETIINYKVEHAESIIIILTTHVDCARKGYLVDAFRYVDKTKMKEELKEAFEKIREINRKNSVCLMGRNGNATKNILVKDILYIETNGRGSIINTMDECYECREKINDLEIKLEEYGFFKCHKSFLINLNSVEHLDKEFVYFPSDKKAYISVRKYTETKKRYIATKKKFASM